MAGGKFVRAGRGFRDDEAGSATVEFVLWLPIFVAILGLMVDATLMLHMQARLWDIARSATRQVALAAMDETAAETFAAEEIGDAYQKSVNITKSGGFVRMVASVQAEDVELFGFLPWTDTIGADYVMADENP